MIKVKIIADSINTKLGDRLTTFLLTYPRYIHAEVMTHRVFSRNAASSRAIPVNRFRQDVLDNPVIPQHWGANQKGMQAHQELDNMDESFSWGLGNGMVTPREAAKRTWLAARDAMLDTHRAFEKIGLHKQIANRVLEPWFHIQLLVSATEYENFFALRCHKDAHPDIQELADEMLFAYVRNNPNPIDPGEWHLPYGDSEMPADVDLKTKIQICTARAARISFKTFEGKIDIDADIELHNGLATNGHWSPFEHCAKAENIPGWYGNFHGWKQYRKMFTDESRKVDLVELYRSRMGLRESRRYDN